MAAAIFAPSRLLVMNNRRFNCWTKPLSCDSRFSTRSGGAFACSTPTPLTEPRAAPFERAISGTRPCRHPPPAVDVEEAPVVVIGAKRQLEHPESVVDDDLRVGRIVLDGVVRLVACRELANAAVRVGRLVGRLGREPLVEVVVASEDHVRIGLVEGLPEGRLRGRRRAHLS